jgi:hypothetical protein
MQNQIFNFSRFASSLKESDEDLLKDLDSLGYEKKFDWATIEKAMKGMLDLKGYVKIEWSKKELYTRNQTTSTGSKEIVYIMNFEYPEDLFVVTVDESSFIRDFIKDLRGYDSGEEGLTIEEIRKAFKDVDVEYAFKDRVNYKKAKVSFSIEEDTRLINDDFGISLTIVKEKEPELENLERAIDDILDSLRFVFF